MAAVASQRLVGQVLRSSSTEYTIVDFIGEGSFSYVFKCQVNHTKELVAVKMLKKMCVQNVENELSILQRISVLDPDHYNLVKFHERFDHSSYTCLVFELLGMDVHRFLTTTHRTSMCVNDIRPIAKQMLVALQGLKSLQIMHRDIKPDNIMLANNEDDTMQVKLIDFGLACSSSSAVCHERPQPIGYRAPEVYLGLPYTEAIDMWGLGCTLANLYLKANIFPRNCEYLMMKSVVEFLGMPSDHQLRLGMHTKSFFCQEEDEFGLRWRLLTPKEYSDVNGVEAQEWPSRRPHFNSLDDLVHFKFTENAEEVKDRWAFIDFLKQLLTLDAGMRFSPTEALQHEFITMTHLSQDPDGGDYLTMAQKFMATNASLYDDSVKDAETDEDEQEFVEVPLIPASSQIEQDVEIDKDEQEFVEVPLIPASRQIKQDDSVVWFRKFFPIIRTTFFGCWCPSVQE